MQTGQFTSPSLAVRHIASVEGIKGLYAVWNLSYILFLSHFGLSPFSPWHLLCITMFFLCQSVLLQGYGSFLLRDLPFDAIQFCIYEQLRIGYMMAVRSLIFHSMSSSFSDSSSVFEFWWWCSLYFLFARHEEILMTQRMPWLVLSLVILWPSIYANIFLTCGQCTRYLIRIYQWTYAKTRSVNSNILIIGALTGAITTPLDVIKTRLMIQVR